MRRALGTGEGSGEEAGAIAVMASLLAVILFIAAALAIDIGKTWATRGDLQTQADQAAMSATSALPVDLNSAASKLVVAKFVAHYLACNKVSGQTYGLPPCSSSLTPSSASLNVAATEMLANGLLQRGPGVRFPSTSSVEVITPSARIDYTFGKAAGSTGTTAVKRATAQVSSPGQMLPIALTRYCGYAGTELGHDALSEVRGQGDSNNAMAPTRVIALGYRADAPRRSYTNIPALPAFNYPGSTSIDTALAFNITAPTLNIATRTWEVGKAGTFWAGPDGGKTWGSGVLDPNIQYWKSNGSGGWVLVAQDHYEGLAGGGATTIPAAVRNVAGSYWVTVSTKYIVGSKVSFIPASQAKQINIVGTGQPADALSRMDNSPLSTPVGTCARYIDSPRKDTGNGVVSGTTVNGSTMIKNLIGGMDHKLGLYGALGHQCISSVVRDSSVHTSGSAADPNCVSMASSNARSQEITLGWIGNPSGSVRGRLDCDPPRFNKASNCLHGTFSLWGRTFNNDDLTDYYTTPMSLATSYRAFGTANYSSDGLPLTSPSPTKLDKEIYYSPRLFWAPVLSTEVDNVPTGGMAGREYPVWTWRPVWIAHQAGQGVVSGAQQGLINLNWCTSGITSGDDYDRDISEYRSGLDDGVTNGNYTGIILNGITRGNYANGVSSLLCNTSDPQQRPDFDEADRRVKGIRFQTIEPVSMPEVPSDYDGPLTDYVGTGPRVVRLVK